MARQYIDAVLETSYLPFQIVHPKIRIMQYDHAHPHTVRVTTAYLQQNNVNVYVTRLLPPIYPPLSTFGISGKEVSPYVPELSRAGCSTARGMAEHLDDYFQRLVHSMHRHCQVFDHGNGGHTQY